MESQKRFIKRSRRKPSEIVDIANERIDILFSRAQLEFDEHPELSNRYVEIARDIAKKFNIHISAEMRRKFCKKCGSYLVPGHNLTVRLLSKERKIIRKCGVCGDEKKVPYNARKS